MEIKYWLAGLDGEATEDRVDNLDRKETELELSKRFKIASALSREIGFGKDGIKILINDLQKV